MKQSEIVLICIKGSYQIIHVDQVSWLLVNAFKIRQITLKMADQEKSDFYVAFTMILCGLNFVSGKL